jgi:hypothetical protein
MFRLPVDLASSCAKNFSEIGTLDILKFIKTNLTTEPKLVENIKGVSKSSKSFTDLMTRLMTLGLLSLLDNSIAKYAFTFRNLSSIATGAEQVSKKGSYNMFI